MHDSMFREYDIRGEVGKDFVVDDAYAFGQALAYYMTTRNPGLKTLAVARDGRTHSPAIEKALIQALCESGINVISIGLVPTPVLYFALFTLDIDGGVMITASHNPPSYNGFKLCLGTEPLSGMDIQEIKACYRTERKSERLPVGTVTKYDCTTDYINWLHKHFNDLIGNDIAAVIDCANGAAGAVIPQLVYKMQWKNVKVLHANVDGAFPNHEADPTTLENMRDIKRAIETEEYNIGFGLDGDGDRLGVLLPDGTLLANDILLSIFSSEVAKKHPAGVIVYDVKTSRALIDHLETIGARGIMASVGHTNIKRIMKKHNALLGGELSGHFFFRDRYFGFDDGIYALMRVLELMVGDACWHEEVCEIFQKWYTSPEIRVDCREEKKKEVVDVIKSHYATKQGYNVCDIDGVRIDTPDGWALIRASNTQPKLSLRFEARDEDTLEQFKSAFSAILHKHNITGI